jgi:hypothetical protein
VLQKTDCSACATVASPCDLPVTIMSAVPVGLISTAMAHAVSLRRPTAVYPDGTGNETYAPLAWTQAKEHWRAIRRTALTAGDWEQADLARWELLLDHCASITDEVIDRVRPAERTGHCTARKLLPGTVRPAVEH